MKTKNETDLLKEIITKLKKKREFELELVQDGLHEVCESLKPLNLIKSAFPKVTLSKEINNNLTNNAIGLGAGFVLKKIVVGNSNNLGKNILGTVIQISVNNIVTKHFGEIKLIGSYLFKQFSESYLVKKQMKKNEFPI